MLNQNVVIPHNVMELDNAEFFEFIKQYSGDKIAILLEFQDISNVDCFLACNDPLEILLFDSDDLLDLKKKTCIKLNTNSFSVLPGIKTKINLLKSALIKKRNQLKTASKPPSNILLINNSSVPTSLANNSTSASVTPSNASGNTSSTSINLKAEEKIKQHLINSLNDWCKKMKANKNENEQFILKENMDYEIIVDIDQNETLIQCKCGVISKLGKKNNSYILSNYIRHLTHQNPCMIVRHKLQNINKIISNDLTSISGDANATVGETTNSTTDTTPSIQTSLEKRKRNQSLEPSLAKKQKNI